MKNLTILMALLAALGCMAFGDTINGGAFNAVPGNFNTTTGTSGVQGTPYWNDFSRDGANATQQGAFNIGYILNGTAPVNNTGNLLGGTGNYLSSGAGQTTQPTAFNFVREATSVTITLLYANSAANQPTGGAATAKVIGWYDTTCGTAANCLNPLYGTGGLASAIPNNFTGTSINTAGTAQTGVNFNPTANWGLYMTTCNFLGTNCFTAFSQSGSNTLAGETAHQHFALFQSASNARSFFVGLEDGLAADSVEAGGDFNDIIFSVSTSSAVPEPATLSIVGLGLLGLGWMRRNRK